MDQKEKVLVYNQTLFLISETFAFHQVDALSDKYDVELISMKFENPHGFDLNCFKKHLLSKPDNLVDRLAGKAFREYYNSSFDLDLKSSLKLRGLLKNGAFKAIHAHFGQRGIEILSYAKQFNIPLIVSFHGYDASKMLRNEKYVQKLPELFDYASGIIISGKHMYDNLKLDKWDEKVHFIPYGVNPDEFDADADLKMDGSEVKNDRKNIKIVHSGRIVGKKGVPDLIRVFNDLESEFKNIELHIVGDGDELEESKKLVNQFDLDNKVTFYGAVAHNKVKSILKMSDIFVLNSRIGKNGDMEGTPVTILEAMILGKAVVSTRHAGIPYVIEHGKNGLLADEKANEELRRNIKILIESPEKRNALGEAARNTITNTYTLDIMRKKLLSVFENI